MDAIKEPVTFDDLIPEWQERLKNRLILNAALAAEWKPGKWYEQDGWYIPLYQANGKRWTIPDGRPAQRWKNYRSSEQPHSTWGYVGQGKDDVKKPAGCDYYWLPGGDIQQRVQEAGGLIFITCGEPDMLSLVEAGRRNVVSFFGERNIPPNVLEIFGKLGVTAVVYYPDNDNTGWDAAQDLNNKFRGTDIKFLAHRLPVEYNGQAVKDVNDLWVACWGEKETFDAVLYEAKTITFLEPRETEVAHVDNSAAWDAYHAEIERKLGAEYRSGRAWSKPMACIFEGHEQDDKKPAASWHKEAHTFRCFKCAKTYYADEVADRLGIKRPEYPTATATAAKQEQTTAATPKLITSDDSLVRYEERLDGAGASDCAPLPFPFKALHESVRAVRPGKLVGVVGVSGGGKTSFVECLNDAWRMQGFHSVWWGPEWNWEEMADRTIQRYGGASMTDMMMHEMWLAEEADNVPMPRRLGEMLLPDMVTKSKRLSASIREWPGKVYYVDQMDIDIDGLLNQVAVTVDRAGMEHGRRIRIAVFDYVQLIQMRGVRGEAEKVNAALGRIKAFCSDNKLVGVVSSQVTKADQKEQKEGGDSLGAEAAQFMRDDKFNLMMTLNPIYDGKGGLTDKGKINVVKNSYGKRKEYTVGIDLARLRWLDTVRGN